MAKIVIIIFMALSAGTTYYYTYQGDTLQEIVTVNRKPLPSARSSSTHYSSHSGSYSGGYSYGK